MKILQSDLTWFKELEEEALKVCLISGLVCWDCCILIGLNWDLNCSTASVLLDISEVLSSSSSSVLISSLPCFKELIKIYLVLVN